MALIGLVGPVVLNPLKLFCFLGQGLLSIKATIKIHKSGVRVVTLSKSPTALQVGDDGSEPAHTKARSGPMDFWYLPGCWGPQAVSETIGKIMIFTKTVARAFELESTDSASCCIRFSIAVKPAEMKGCLVDYESMPKVH